MLPVLPFLLRNWRLAAGAALLAGLLWALPSYGQRRSEAGAASVQAQWDAEKAQIKAATIERYETEIAAYKSRLTQQEAASAALAATLSTEQDRSNRLQSALSRAKLVTHEPDPVNPSCPVPRLSGSFRLCVNAAVTGTDPALADCEAVGMRVPAAP